MSLFDSASLVVTPNGVKEGKLYSIKPTDGSGDLSVTRATTATRVNSAGLVEVVPRNLVTYSNTFSNSDWVKSDVTFTSGQEDPFGGTNGWRYLTTNASNGYVFQDGITINGQQMTLSFWVKSNTGSNQTFRMTANSGSQSSPTLTANSTWQRVTWSFTSSNGGSNVLIAYNGTSILDLLIYGFQAESSATATDYYPTTTRLNIPRLDYTNSSCPSILVEPQRTNLALYSQDYSNIYWFKQGTTIISNNSISPSGNLDATLMNAGTSFGEHNIYNGGGAISITANVDYTFSFFVKKGTGRYIAVALYYIGGGFGAYGTYDLNTNTLVSSGGGVGTLTSTKLETFNDGWVRISVTGKANYTSLFVSIDIKNASNLVPGPFFTGANETFNIWGAQLEQGSYPTSYIPTTSASVTRNADVISKTGISSLIGQTEGTALLDFEFNGEDESIIMDIAANGLSPQNRIILYQPNTTIVQFIVLDNSIAQVNIASSSYSVGQRLKVAIAYKLNDFAFYINGVQIGTSGSGTVPLTNRIDIGNRQDGGYPSPISVNNAILFKTRLTNDQLAQLTTI
jgi:hypothetical protein